MKFALRRLWLRLRRYDGEVCQSCDRPVEVIWTAPDEMWQQITGRTDGGGVLCLRCFDDFAVTCGRVLRWVPEDVDAWRAHQVDQPEPA